ncbi:hypothetical protein BVC80_9009g3 [Macleaya cordata]|uniref:Uncharacterized protein n=1 Tax=Macleaya cordata TaxID=56857 RepID=A0A200QM23_MACCD|nr:hypothetical protein BVC80_9009g3 [Macleaya cordata]
MADFGAPSFSLGLDLDFESENPPEEEPACEPPPEHSIDVSSQSFEEDEHIQEQTLKPNIQVEDSPPILKRLRRGPSSQSSGVQKREPMFISSTVDDDIEDFSSQEDSPRDTHSSVQNRSAWSTTKFTLPCHRVLPNQWVSKPKAQKDTPCSNASASTSLDPSEKKMMFPKLTISPLRRFQLLDSDSDDLSAGDDLYKDASTVDSSGKKRQRSPSQFVAGNQQKKANISSATLQSEDLWKDFTPKKSLKILTPALDEFCEEYFMSVKDSNVNQRKGEDIHLSSSKACFLEKGISESIGKDGRPPAYQYFYHDDLRIQRLVRDRLPYFFPLGVKENRLDKQSDAAAIDYMSQFGHRETPGQSCAKGNKNLEQNPKRGRKNLKNSNAKEAFQASANWVNPKSCVNIPKDAGKRRVHANNRSAGHWYTNPDGRKVYVTKNGQELTGRIAYRHHRKESGAGSKKSRKKASPKKKSKR